MPTTAVIIMIFIASFMYAFSRPKSVTHSLLFIVLLTGVSVGAMAIPSDFVVNLFN